MLHSSPLKAPTQGSEGACPHCQGTGWILRTKGKADYAVRCRCVADRERERLMQEAGIPRRYADCTLDNFLAKNRSLTKAKRRAARFADEFPAVKAGLLFIGPPGVGKTHLAVATLKSVIQKISKSCLYCDYRDILKHIQDSYSPESPTTEMRVLEPVLSCELLVLDEIGAQRVTAWMHDMIFYILNQRYSNRMTTIMTSNFLEQRSSKEEETLADRVGFRLESRLHEMCEFVEMEGEDFRKTQLHQRTGESG